MKSLREQLFGPAMPLRDKLALANSTDPVKLNSDFDVIYKKPKPEAPVTFGLPKEMGNKSNIKPIRKLDQPFIGTNYDPYDVEQNRPDATEENIGLGAAGVKIKENMVAVSRKPKSDEAMVRLGTVLRDPETKELYLVADLMNRRFDGQNKIDFATPKTGKEINEKYNRSFEGLEVVREGQGYEDVRAFVESGEWDKMKNSL